jgi:hypothetical protein
LAQATPPPEPSLTVARLVQFLVDDAGDPLAAELARWLSDSARFWAFATQHRAKIRKKLRGATESGARRDVRAELAVARLLVADRRVELDFEAYGSGGRGPDFTATLGSQRFNLEITRLHGDPAAAGYSALLSKLRQLPPSIPNGVVLSIEGYDARAYDVDAAVRALRTRADAKDEALFTARGFAGTRAFYDRFLRLGCVFVWAEGASSESRVMPWANASARTPVPAKAMRTVTQSLRSDL